METKICTKCEIEKSLDDFSWRNKSIGKKHSWCKKCSKTRDNENYQLDEKRRIQIAESSKKLMGRNKKFVNEYKENHNCVNCGDDRPYVLDFHHRDSAEKENEIPNMVSSGYSIKKLKEEMDKCDILCANCHREYHFINGY